MIIRLVLQSVALHNVERHSSIDLCPLQGQEICHEELSSLLCTRLWHWREERSRQSRNTHCIFYRLLESAAARTPASTTPTVPTMPTPISPSLTNLSSTASFKDAACLWLGETCRSKFFSVPFWKGKRHFSCTGVHKQGLSALSLPCDTLFHKLLRTCSSKINEENLMPIFHSWKRRKRSAQSSYHAWNDIMQVNLRG